MEKINRKTVQETKDASGEIIKKVIIKYEPMECDDPAILADEQAKQEFTKDAQISQIKIAEWVCDDWKYTVLTNSKDIKLWLFENE